MEMPRYRCHKEVWALKIKELSHVSMLSNAARMIPEDGRYAPIDLSEEYMVKHEPEVGGYYVVYADGYQSYSPAEPFESGYALIVPEPPLSPA